MKKHLLKVLIILSMPLFIISCGPNLTNELLDQNIVVTDTLEKKEITIISNSVNVFSVPGNDQVVFQLNKNDLCEYVSQGNSDTIDNFIDFWYQINYKGQQGWVFGSKTSLCQNSGFENYLRIFSNDSKDSISSFYVNKYLKGVKGYLPLEYKKLKDNRYAALYLKKTISQEAEILLVIYEYGILIKDFKLFSGSYLGCTLPQAFFTTNDLIKVIKPVCNNLGTNNIYYQILKDNNIKELKSTIISKSVDGLLPKIKGELRVKDESLSKGCKCTVHSSIKDGYSNKNIVFYTVVQDQCDVYCSSLDYSLIAMNDSIEWSIKMEEKGVFKALYESGIKNKSIVLLKETRIKHIYEKIVVERLFLLDYDKKTMKELNLKSESCTILAPTNYGCDFCKDHVTHTEELIITGNPVQQILKKTTDITYNRDDACKLIKETSKTETYLWNTKKEIFELQ